MRKCTTSAAPNALQPSQSMKSDVVTAARSPTREEGPQKRRSELDDVAMEISNSLDRKQAKEAKEAKEAKVPKVATTDQPEAPTKPFRSKKDKKKKKKKKKKKEPTHFELRNFKFIEEVDDQYVMEYRLTLDEIMEFRKNHFQLEKEPKIMVRDTKASELKEEFGTYCGVKKTIKNWLYWV